MNEKDAAFHSYPSNLILRCGFSLIMFSDLKVNLQCWSRPCTSPMILDKQMISLLNSIMGDVSQT